MHSHRIVQVGRDLLNHLVQVPGSSKISRISISSSSPERTSKACSSVSPSSQEKSFLMFTFCFTLSNLSPLSFVLSVTLLKKVCLLNSSLHLLRYLMHIEISLSAFSSPGCILRSLSLSLYEQVILSHQTTKNKIIAHILKPLDNVIYSFKEFRKKKRCATLS